MSSLEERINRTRSGHPKKWGREYWIVNDEYCGKILMLNKGYQCSTHHHKIKKETFYVNEGLVLIQVNGEMSLMRPGESLEIRPGDKHRFIGITDAKIIEFSTHHEEEDSYRESESGKVPEDVFRSYEGRYAAEIAESD